MAEDLIQLYNSLDEATRREVYDFAQFLSQKNVSMNKNRSQEHLQKFLGTINDEDAEIMLAAVDECRKVEA